MIAVIKKTWKSFQEGGECVAEFTCSSVNALAKLPTAKNSDVGAGSTCICTEDASFYMLGADDLWHKL